MKAPKLMLPSEFREHIAFVTLYLKPHGFTYIHVPNGEKRSARTGAKLKAMGVQAGFPDFLVFDAPQTAIEMKRADGGKRSSAQEWWELRLEMMGWQYILAHGAQDAIDKMERIYRKK